MNKYKLEHSEETGNGKSPEHENSGQQSRVWLTQLVWWRDIWLWRHIISQVYWRCWVVRFERVFLVSLFGLIYFKFSIKIFHVSYLCFLRTLWFFFCNWSLVVLNDVLNVFVNRTQFLCFFNNYLLNRLTSSISKTKFAIKMFDKTKMYKNNNINDQKLT